MKEKRFRLLLAGMWTRLAAGGRWTHFSSVSNTIYSF